MPALYEIKGRPQDRFVYAAEAEAVAVVIARTSVDSHVRMISQTKISVTLTTVPKSSLKRFFYSRSGVTRRSQKCL
jgi:hypothetical protein